jgi:hypothetical protein
MQHNVLILDFGSHTQLIARRVRELNILRNFSIQSFPSDLSQSRNFRWKSFFCESRRCPHPDLSQIRVKLPMHAMVLSSLFLVVK